MAKLNIVLYEPEIPQNTGNIARLCACTGASLYLVGKLGFALTDKYTKRAGLDYWDSVNIRQVPSLEELFEEFPNEEKYFLQMKEKYLEYVTWEDICAAVDYAYGQIKPEYNKLDFRVI